MLPNTMSSDFPVENFGNPKTKIQKYAEAIAKPNQSIPNIFFKAFINFLLIVIGFVFPTEIDHSDDKTYGSYDDWIP